MPILLIEDFLQTQGLKLPVDDIRVAYAAIQAVINLGGASIDRHLLWPEQEGFKLTEHIAQTAENEAVLKQVFMALDSVYSRQGHIGSAAVYAKIPSENPVPKLVLLTRQGLGLEPHLQISDENNRTYLAVRTAQSGWMNVADDISYWLASGEISGGRNTAGTAQVSVPICSGNGAVLGVLHIEFEEKNKADDAALCEWAALSLALRTPLKALLDVADEEEEQHD